MEMTVLMKMMVLVLLVAIPSLIAPLLLRKVRSWFGLSHPWWTHLPAVGVLLVTTEWTALLIVFGAEGPSAYVNHVNQYPTLGQFVSYFAPIGILVIGISVLIDELWARQEIRKTFNWMSLLDEVAIGVMLGYGKAHYFFPSTVALGTLRHTVGINGPGATLVAVMIAAAALLEAFRRPAPREKHVIAETGALEAELTRRAESGERIAYFESQNPAHVTVLVIVVGALLIFAAVMSWRATMPWVALLLLLTAGATALVYGGMRVSVTSTLLDVRLGMLGIRLLTLPTAEINEVSVGGAAGVQDLGDRGRQNREVRAFSLSGPKGVGITTALGRKYLIGSDHPERLAAVLRAVMAKR
jgi:hypothetical protein